METETGLPAPINLMGILGWVNVARKCSKDVHFPDDSYVNFSINKWRPIVLKGELKLFIFTKNSEHFLYNTEGLLSPAVWTVSAPLRARFLFSQRSDCLMRDVVPLTESFRGATKNTSVYSGWVFGTLYVTLVLIVCGVNQSSLLKWLLLQNCLKINRWTLFSSKSFPLISARPQKPQKLTASKSMKSLDQIF